MHIDQIPLDHLRVSKANMRGNKKPPDISDILPSIIKRGVISPLFVRPGPVPRGAEGCQDCHFEIVAGINPATGLPMTGGIDVAGNPFGTNHDHWHSHDGFPGRSPDGGSFGIW